jgi:hypothetical protein
MDYRWRKPLALVGHGVRLRAHQGTTLVRNGFTRYPQKREDLRLFPGDPKLNEPQVHAHERAEP